MNYEIFGPPGTGKTTELARLTRTAVYNHGSRVIVASLTRAAAAEISGRHLGLPNDRVGTLHAHCHRAMGSPSLYLDLLETWNHDYPAWKMTIRKRAPRLGAPVELDAPPDHESRGRLNGDALLQAYDLERHRMRPPIMWTERLRSFAEAWERWKHESDVVDFTDLLEYTLHDCDTAPGNPEAGIFDEIQDFSRLEFALVEKWARSMESVCLAGDEDQACYEWRGASPQAMIDFPRDAQKILDQSYRLPAAIHHLSQGWIRQIANRVDKPFAPRDELGSVRTVPWSYQHNAALILRDAERALTDGKSVMILASCEYMLRPIVAEARRQGAPFHNPYRRHERRWNPLQATQGVSASRRLLSYLRPNPEVWGEDRRPWTGADLAIWAQHLRPEVLGGPAVVTTLPGDQCVSAEWLDVHVNEAWLDLLERTPTAYRRALRPSEIKRYVYPLTVATRRGAHALREEPRLVIGTIHSVKGGEADIVYLSPELSPAGAIDWRRNRDAVVRQFYVGMTRARESLVLVSAATRAASIPRLSPRIGEAA